MLQLLAATTRPSRVVRSNGENATGTPAPATGTLAPASETTVASTGEATPTESLLIEVPIAYRGKLGIFNILTLNHINAILTRDSRAR